MAKTQLSLKTVSLHKPVGRRILGLIVAGALLVGAQRAGWLSPLKVVADYTITPIGSFFAGLGRGADNWWETAGNLSRLAAENKRLERENTELRRRLSEADELKAENASLRRELNFSQGSPFKLLTAKVTAYQPDNFRQFLTLNRGSSDGVKVGLAIVSEGVLVGKISEVSRTSSKVFLLSDPDFRVAAIAQTSRASGIVRGQIGGGLLMDKIPQSDAIEVGDTVISSGLGGEFPGGLIIGRVESVDSAKGAVFQSARVSSSLRLSKLELVSVILEEGE